MLAEREGLFVADGRVYYVASNGLGLREKNRYVAAVFGTPFDCRARHRSSVQEASTGEVAVRAQRRRELQMNYSSPKMRRGLHPKGAARASTHKSDKGHVLGNVRITLRSGHLGAAFGASALCQ